MVWGALLSAHANNGANAGFGYLNTNNRSSNSNANNGFRLYRGNEIRYIGHHNPASQKLITIQLAGKKIQVFSSVSKELKALDRTTAHVTMEELNLIKSKRLKNIYPMVYSTDNLVKAQYNAQKRKGIRTEIINFNNRICENLIDLYHMLENESYVPGKYRIKTVKEPKERQIMIAPFFPDRIIHHCIINVLGEIWTKVFIQNTYACIKGRGTHKCMEDIHNSLMNDKRGTKYCLKIDIKKFYDNVDHSVLKQIIRYKIGDTQMLGLLDKIIDSNGQNKGLPIGNFTSQYFANLYLAYFDHWVKENLKVKYYYRYMDDMVMLHKDKAALHSILDKMGLYLGSVLKLEIKSNWQIFDVDSRSIDYVGFKQNHYGILLRKKILMTFYKKFDKINKKYSISNIDDLKHLFPSEFGWITRCSEEHSNFIIKKCLQNGKAKCFNNRVAC